MNLRELIIPKDALPKSAMTEEYWVGLASGLMVGIVATASAYSKGLYIFGVAAFAIAFWFWATWNRGVDG